MSKQYYVYIPFKPTSAGLPILKGEVDKWVQRIQLQINQATMIVNGVTASLARSGVEAYQKTDAKAKLALNHDLLAKLPHKKPILLLHGAADVKGGVLKVLSTLEPSSYALYVLGHCAPGSMVLFDTVPKTAESELLSATALVDRMVNVDELPKNIRHLKLLACYGGVAHNESPAYYVSLVESLTAKGYADFKLTAYTEPVFLSEFYKGPGGHKMAADLKLGVPVPASVPIKGRLKDHSVAIEAQQYAALKVLAELCKLIKENPAVIENVLKASKH